jgi:hypothetical protein
VQYRPGAVGRVQADTVQVIEVVGLIPADAGWFVIHRACSTATRELSIITPAIAGQGD